MVNKVVVSAKAVQALERRLVAHDRRIAREQQRRAQVIERIEAMKTLLRRSAKAGSPKAPEKPAEKPRPAGTPQLKVVELPAAVSVPQAVEQALRKRGPLTAVEIRGAIMEAGVKREQLGATYSYLYTVLGRLKQRHRVVHVRGKYRLPEAANTVVVPGTGELKVN